MNRRVKFDAANFILGRKIRIRTNTQKNKQKRNSKRYIHTCLSACVDNNSNPFNMQPIYDNADEPVPKIFNHLLPIFVGIIQYL